MTGRIRGPVVVLVMILAAVPASLVVQRLTGDGEAERLRNVPVPAMAVDRLDLGGRPGIIHFWGSWCLQCRNQLPLLDDIRAAHPELAVVGVVFRDPMAKATETARRLGAGWPQLSDPDDELAGAFGVDSAPALFFVDRAGIIRGNLVGPIHKPLVERQLRKIL